MDLAMGEDDDMCAVLMARFGNSQAREDKHLCAVVQAMAEVLKERSLDPTPTAYFAATMSCLDRQAASSAACNEAVTTALCTFLAMVLHKTPASVIRSKCDAALNLLGGLIGAGSESANTVKAAISCLELVIRGADTNYDTNCDILN